MKAWVRMSWRVAALGAAVAVVSALPLAQASAAQAKTAGDLYRDKCAVCHGEDGAGKTARGKRLKVKDVRETVKKMTPEQMADVVAKGKDPDMDGFAKEFNAEQIRQIVAYYRELAAAK